jgi:hypothetical protein
MLWNSKVRHLGYIVYVIISPARTLRCCRGNQPNTINKNEINILGHKLRINRFHELKCITCALVGKQLHHQGNDSEYLPVIYMVKNVHR